MANPKKILYVMLHCQIRLKGKYVASTLTFTKWSKNLMKSRPYFKNNFLKSFKMVFYCLQNTVSLFSKINRTTKIPKKLKKMLFDNSSYISVQITAERKISLLH
jgi:hypothetical protein